MTIPYTYEIVFRDVPAKCMVVEYSAVGQPTLQVGVPLPATDDDTATIIEMYAPIAHWPNATPVYEDVAVGSEGISLCKVDAPLAHLWAEAAQSVGMQLSDVSSKYVLPLSGQGALEISAREGVSYLSTDALNTVSDRQALAALGVDVLPTVTPRNAAELLAVGTGAIFLKPANTALRKSKDALAYTKWDSPQHLLDAVDDTFWVKQADAATALSVQPLVPSPVTELSIGIAVNEASQAFAYLPALEVSETPGKYSLFKTLEHVPQYVLDDIQKVCTALSIKGGVHDVQFIQYRDRFYMNDWNARPRESLSTGLVMEKKVRQSALAHMVGAAVPEVPPFYGEQRGYWGENIPASMADVARAMGMFARVDDGFLSRVYCEGLDVETVHAQFNLFESKL